MNPLLLAVALLKLDIDSGTVTTRQWPDAGESVAIGSLAKPFIAIAYAEGHAYRYPRLKCNPKACWLPRGHGEVGIEEAIAQSCNVYFNALRKQIPLDLLQSTARRYGFDDVDRSPPEALLRAYVELQRRAAEPGVAPILTGLRRAASHGTARLLAHDALAKTGTAPCSHTPKSPGDGFAIVLHPAVAPKTALIVRLHGRPGSHAAREAAKSLP
ncbi:MAG: hypothetical protein JNK48_03955 [Bryobacterales bacterium]|nr:hypothetical protein [Bryobacterales bacterium]